MSYGVGRRCGLDLALLCLWLWPASRVLIWPLAWEPPCAAGVALKSKKKKEKRKKGRMFSGKLIKFKSSAWLLKLLIITSVCFCFVFVFFLLGLHMRHMEVPRLGVRSDLRWPVPQQQQWQIQTMSATYSNVGSLTNWVRPGIEPTSSWILVWFVTAESQWELHFCLFLKENKNKNRLYSDQSQMNVI